MNDRQAAQHVSIRRATPDDSLEVFSLASDFATSFRPERTMFLTAFSALLADESALLLVVARVDTVVGYLLGFDHYALFANGPVSWVEEIMVREDSRRQGLGEKLMMQFEKWAKSRDSRLVALATRRAAPFYRAQGYEESATYFRKVL